jgi:murein DD-endopeptidase MepM/ murein hydrolase activator NlpD
LKPKKTLSSWLTNRYLLIFRNEENFAEKTTFSFTYAKLLVFLFILFGVFMFLSLYLSKTMLAQWFDPRHSEIESNKKLIELSLSIDSLANEVRKKDIFISNFQRIVKGEDLESGVEKTSEAEIIARYSKELELSELAEVDSQFRRQFEEVGVTLFSNRPGTSAELQELYFFTPINGIVSSPYNPQNEHYGVDVVAKTNEPVKCIADGTVLFSSWTQDSGYVLAVQHRSNLISIYKHNSALLKKVGNFVSAGEIIAIIGNTGELTTGPHLHFELWYNGNPVNPQEFVSF